jgi:hypothetical protein
VACREPPGDVRPPSRLGPVLLVSTGWTNPRCSQERALSLVDIDGNRIDFINIALSLLANTTLL